TMVHDPPQKATTLVQQHIRTSDALLPSPIQPGNLEVFASPTSLNRSFSLVILVTKDLVEEKLNAIASIEPLLNPDAIVAVNMESITLQELQPHVQAPERVIGLNWVEPAHTSFFLEIIGNVKTDKKVMEEIDRLGKSWGKDPYTIEVGFSVRARLHAALTREALFQIVTLHELQPHVQAPERVIGLNWVEPAHTSFFLEIIGNVKTDKKVMEEIDRLGKSWGKDPYTIEVGFSVRARLHAALTREALF